MSASESLPDHCEFTRLQRQQAEKKLPPVHLWKPAREGSIDIRINLEGRWLHEGSEIKRKELLRLFASILLHEQGQYYLVTPVEKLLIEVEDAPFLAIDLEVYCAPDEQKIGFVTNVNDFVVADEDHPLTMRGGRPYIEVRKGLEALISRSVYYHLAQLAIPARGREEVFGVESCGKFFALVSES